MSRSFRKVVTEYMHAHGIANDKRRSCRKERRAVKQAINCGEEDLFAVGFTDEWKIGGDGKIRTFYCKTKKELSK